MQLTIPLEQRQLHRFDNFDAGANAELISRLRALATQAMDRPQGEPGVWLTGEPGSGRSHLLEASCQEAERAGLRAFYVPLGELPREPQVLESLEGDLIALDDVEVWLGVRELEAALMALYQGQLQRGAGLLVSGAGTAQQAAFVLPDLASRFRALAGYRVQPPDDVGLRRILTDAAHRQGLVLTEGVLDYWLHRAARSLPVLLSQLRLLDERALVEQRRVTIPLIKEVLKL